MQLYPQTNTDASDNTPGTTDISDNQSERKKARGWGIFDDWKKMENKKSLGLLRPDAIVKKNRLINLFQLRAQLPIQPNLPGMMEAGTRSTDGGARSTHRPYLVSSQPPPINSITQNAKPVMWIQQA